MFTVPAQYNIILDNPTLQEPKINEAAVSTRAEIIYESQMDLAAPTEIDYNRVRL